MPVAMSSVGTGAPPIEVAGVTTANVALVVVAAAPLMVSPVKALPADGLPVAPLATGNGSFVATTGAAPTVIVAVVVAQLVGFSFSHNLYVIGYTPAGVPGGTLTCPVVGSSTGTGAPGVKGVAGVVTANVALPVGPTVGGVMPLTVSLLSTLPALGLPVAPFGTLYGSGVATIGAGSTVTVIVASLQFKGTSFSQSL